MRPAAADRRRARTGDRVREGRTGPRTPARLVSTESAREPVGAVVEGNQFASTAARVSSSAEKVLGKASLGTRISGGQFRYDHRRDDPRVH